MFVFFTIPWIFVAVAILIAVAAGVSVLQFIVDHIIVISVVLAVLIVFLVRAIWKDKEDAEENKVEINALPVFAGSILCGPVPVDHGGAGCTRK